MDGYVCVSFMTDKKCLTKIFLKESREISLDYKEVKDEM